MIPRLDRHPRVCRGYPRFTLSSWPIPDREKIHNWGKRICTKETGWLDMQRCIENSRGQHLCDRVRVSMANGKVLGYFELSRSPHALDFIRCLDNLKHALHPAIADAPEKDRGVENRVLERKGGGSFL